MRPLLLLALTACGEDTPAPPASPPAELVFVRDAVIAPAGATGQVLPDGRVLVDQPWTTGQPVAVGGAEGVAPRRAECVPLYQQDLGDVQRLIAMGGGPPNTDLAWSPDGSRLAVGTHTGEVLVLDGWTGEVQARQRFAETMVKHVAWSPDSGTLYAAEQSPDANVMALDPATLAARWTLRLADIVETTAAPSGEDIYGVYDLPAAYGLHVLDGGDLVLSALHSWTDEAGVARNRSQVLRVTPDGRIAAHWPESPADATLKHPQVSGDRVAVIVSRSADGPPPADLPLGGVQVLSLPDLVPIRRATTPPLAPWFTKANIWGALDIDARSGRLLMGFGDGRVRVLEDDGTDALLLSTGAPIMAGDVPIHASIGWGLLHGDRALFTTSGTHIPWGAASPETRPPSVHPSENTLWAYDMNGELAWSWTGGQAIQGITLGADGRHLVAGAGDRETDSRRDLYGALVFDLEGAPVRSGDDRLRAFCPTEGPVFFRQALSADGRLAVAEHPYADEDGAVKGAYRVTVLR
jgi:hypothetical protein